MLFQKSKTNDYEDNDLKSKMKKSKFVFSYGYGILAPELKNYTQLVVLDDEIIVKKIFTDKEKNVNKTLKKEKQCKQVREYFLQKGVLNQLEVMNNIPSKDLKHYKNSRIDIIYLKVNGNTYSFDGNSANMEYRNFLQKTIKKVYSYLNINYLYNNYQYRVSLKAPANWIEFNTDYGHPIFKFVPINISKEQVLFKFGGIVSFSPALYGQYTVEKIGEGTEKEFQTSFDNFIKFVSAEENNYKLIKKEKIDQKSKIINRAFIRYTNSNITAIVDYLYINGHILTVGCPLCLNMSDEETLNSKNIELNNYIIDTIKMYDNIKIKEKDEKTVNDDLEMKNINISNEIDEMSETNIKEKAYEILSNNLEANEQIVIEKLNDSVYYAYVSTNRRGPGSMIIGKDMSFLWGGSAYDKDKLISAYKSGKRSLEKNKENTSDSDLNKEDKNITNSDDKVNGINISNKLNEISEDYIKNNSKKSISEFAHSIIPVDKLGDIFWTKTSEDVLCYFIMYNLKNNNKVNIELLEKNLESFEIFKDICQNANYDEANKEYANIVNVLTKSTDKQLHSYYELLLISLKIIPLTYEQLTNKIEIIKKNNYFLISNWFGKNEVGIETKIIDLKTGYYYEISTRKGNSTNNYEYVNRCCFIKNSLVLDFVKYIEENKIFTNKYSEELILDRGTTIEVSLNNDHISIKNEKELYEKFQRELELLLEKNSDNILNLTDSNDITINLSDELIDLICDKLKITKEQIKQNSKELVGIDAYYFWNPIKGGISVIIKSNGERLFATSSVNFLNHLEEFCKGKRN